MTSGDGDNGLTRDALLNCAWALVVVAAVTWVRFAYLLDREAPLGHELGLWLGAAVSSTVLAAMCGVVAAVKAVEQRQLGLGLQNTSPTSPTAPPDA